MIDHPFRRLYKNKGLNYVSLIDGLCLSVCLELLKRLKCYDDPIYSLMQVLEAVSPLLGGLGRISREKNVAATDTTEKENLSKYS
jgi:hypothetical protein